jgi:hypothetical protein
MISGLINQGFAEKQYGVAYWTDIQERFNNLLDTSVDSTGTVSENAGNKTVLRSKIKRVLNSLIHLIKANYPDTYKSVMRSWGFQKERY